MSKFTNEERQWLIENYQNKWKIFCMNYLWKTEWQIRGKASELWLKQNINSEFFRDWQYRAKINKIWKKRPLHSEFMKKYIRETNNTIFVWERDKDYRKIISDRTKKWIKEKWHPRWMLWKHQTEKSKLSLSKRSKDMWANPNSKVNSELYRQELSNRVSLQQSKWMIYNWYSRAKKSKYEHNWKIYSLRSDWERIYCKYLDLLIKWWKILDWEYESEVFWFLKIKRWVRSYKPDYKIYNIDWSIEYHEVKWRMDWKSQTKINRMKIYYPEIKLKIIRGDFIKKLKQYII